METILSAVKGIYYLINIKEKSISSVMKQNLILYYFSDSL